VTSCLQALAITDREQGASLDTVAILHIVSSIRLDLSEYAEAHRAALRATQMVGDLVVDERDAPVLAQLRVRTIANLARVERTLGQLDLAERHYLEALAEAEELAGAGDANLAPLLNDLAVVYKYAARFEEAEALYQRALAATEATLGPDHLRPRPSGTTLAASNTPAVAMPPVNPTPVGPCRSARRR
jgi:tetratricopeptide (TPR) repeat protein